MGLDERMRRDEQKTTTQTHNAQTQTTVTTRGKGVGGRWRWAKVDMGTERNFAWTMGTQCSE